MTEKEIPPIISFDKKYSYLWNWPTKMSETVCEWVACNGKISGYQSRKIGMILLPKFAIVCNMFIAKQSDEMSTKFGFQFLMFW